MCYFSYAIKECVKYRTFLVVMTSWRKFLRTQSNCLVLRVGNDFSSLSQSNDGKTFFLTSHLTEISLYRLFPPSEYFLPTFNRLSNRKSFFFALFFNFFLIPNRKVSLSCLKSFLFSLFC